MLIRELQDIKDYWMNKYPNINVGLWSNEDNTEYYGLMTGCDSTVDLKAKTIGELISQGESFLRKFT